MLTQSDKVRDTNFICQQGSLHVPEVEGDMYKNL